MITYSLNTYSLHSVEACGKIMIYSKKFPFLQNRVEFISKCTGRSTTCNIVKVDAYRKLSEINDCIFWKKCRPVNKHESDYSSAHSLGLRFVWNIQGRLMKYLSNETNLCPSWWTCHKLCMYAGENCEWNVLQRSV